MKCRICGEEIKNDFQLVCDECTERHEEEEDREFVAEMEEM